jgi:hypothetical protein
MWYGLEPLTPSPLFQSAIAFRHSFRDIVCDLFDVFSSQQISKASDISRYDEIARRANIYAECQQFDSVCDMEHDMGKEVDLILAKCRHAEDEVYPPARTLPFSQSARSSRNSHNIKSIIPQLDTTGTFRKGGHRMFLQKVLRHVW